MEDDEIPSYRDEPIVSKDAPFELEITPKKLIIPSSGRLEVSMKNPTKKKMQLWITSYSLYFRFEVKGGSSRASSWERFKEELQPGATATIIIRLRNKTDMPNILDYHSETPEGYFIIAHDNYSEDSIHALDGAAREFIPIMEEETEFVKNLKEKFLEIRKIQNRQKRWREMNPKGDLPPYEKMKDMVPRHPNLEKLSSINCEWIHDFPPNFEGIDTMTDEDLKKMKMDTMRKFIEKYEKCVEDEKIREKERTEEKLKEEDAKKNLEVESVEEPKKSVIQKASESAKPVSTVSEVKKTNVKVDEVKPKEQGKNPVVAKKQMKEKKKNPCCVVM